MADGTRNFHLVMAVLFETPTPRVSRTLTNFLAVRFVTFSPSFRTIRLRYCPGSLRAILPLSGVSLHLPHRRCQRPSRRHLCCFRGDSVRETETAFCFPLPREPAVLAETGLRVTVPGDSASDARKGTSPGRAAWMLPGQVSAAKLPSVLRAINIGAAGASVSATPAATPRRLPAHVPLASSQSSRLSGSAFWLHPREVLQTVC